MTPIGYQARCLKLNRSGKKLPVFTCATKHINVDIISVVMEELRFGTTEQIRLAALSSVPYEFAF